MTAKETLTEWLEKGDTEQVLKGLSVVCKRWGHKDLASDISFQSGRFRELKTQQNRNTISQAEFQLEAAKIRQAILSLIQTFPEHWSDEGLTEIPSNIINTKNNKLVKLATVLIGLIVLLMLIAKCSGISVRNIFGKDKLENHNANTPNTINNGNSTTGNNSPIITTQGDVYYSPSEGATPKASPKKDSSIINQ
jgi:hypothetical protein